MDISPLRDLPNHTILTSNPTLKPMNPVAQKHHSRRPILGFTLVEMLVVIAIMSILMTAGAIGLGGMGGKGVTSGVASAESIFDEARATAIGKSTTTRVLIALDLTNAPAENLRKVVIVTAELDPATGLQKTPLNWVLSSRGVTLPDQTFFSKTYSMLNHSSKTGFGLPSEMTLGTSYKSAFVGKYLFYEFNSEGICTTPGASFVLGAGSRGLSALALKEQPRTTSAGKRDFGGFVIWRNGRTSIFRGPAQIDVSIQSLGTGEPF